MTDVTVSALHERVLQAAAADLANQFHGIFNRETIEAFLNVSYADMSSRGPAGRYTPVLVERFVRDRLRALARDEGSIVDDDKAVLFLCVRNAGRSQMALGWFNHLVDGRAIGWSGGTEPGGEVNSVAVDAMAELGINISNEFPKPWTDEIVHGADVVVTMGCGEACPLFPGKRYEDWELNDPEGKSLDGVRRIRDEIGAHVRRLVEGLGIHHT